MLRCFPFFNNKSKAFAKSSIKIKDLVSFPVPFILIIFLFFLNFLLFE